MDRKIRQALIDIVGEGNYTDTLIDLVSYSYDASEHSHRPFCGVWVKTAEEVSEVLKLAGREKIPVIPRGAGTGLSGSGAFSPPIDCTQETKSHQVPNL